MARGIDELTNINTKQLRRLANVNKTTGTAKTIAQKKQDMAELRAIQRELVKASNQRIRRLEEQGLMTRDKFESVKNPEDLIKNVRDMQKFLGQKTSLVSGAKDFVKKQEQAMEAYGIDFQNDEEYQEFEEIYRALKDKGYTAEMERLGYGYASERVALFYEALTLKVDKHGRDKNLSQAQWQRAIIKMLRERFA